MKKKNINIMTPQPYMNIMTTQPKELETTINLMIKDGYIPLGGMTIFNMDTTKVGFWIYCQTMIKQDTESNIILERVLTTPITINCDDSKAMSEMIQKQFKEMIDSAIKS